jgi:hypothetical protein
MRGLSHIRQERKRDIRGGEVCLCWSQLERRSAQAKASPHQLAPDRSPLFLGVAPYCRRRRVLDLDPLPGAAGAICTLVHA